MLVEFPTDEQVKDEAKRRKVTDGLVVAFYTKDSIYEAEAQRMIASASRLGLKIHAQAVDSTGSWVRNASLKAQFLAQQRALHRGPLLYVDVDAVFHADPWVVLNSVDADIQCYYDARGHLLSGTIWISDTIQAQKLLDVWALRCNSDPDIWDQSVLQSIISEDSIQEKPEYKVSPLPVEFCWIFDKIDNPKVKKVYIEHLQASREAKLEKNSVGMIKSKLKRRRKRTAVIEKILFKH